MKFYDKMNDNGRAQSGIGAQLNVWDEDLSKYKLLIPLESVVSVVGSVNTIDVDLLTSPIISKILGKTTIDDKDQEFLWHRDSLNILMKYTGETHKFLVSYPDLTGVEFEGTIQIHPDDTTSDKLTGTMTIIASSINEEPILNVRDMMVKTCVITSIIPDEVSLAASDTTGKTFKLTSKESGVTWEVESDNSAIVGTVSSNVLTIKSGSGASSGDNAILTITCSKDGLASWSTTVAVVVE